LADVEPAIHVNAFEAEAYCAWAGRRLPTETEWECAALSVAEASDPNLDHRRAGPCGVDLAGMGLAHLFGNVWEWTATTFEPYPGFAADPYADYSAPWFGDHRVLRGGSFATRSRLVHARWRNFYRPERSDMFCGFRTCAV
jgi:iron(II)-dependent oxidoreductase